MASIIHYSQIPDKGLMRVRFKWESVDPIDSGLCKKLGEPRVNTGGIFTDPKDPSFTWTEPDGYTFLISLSSGVLENAYDSTKDPIAQRRASVWGAVMQTRLTDALSAIRSLGDTFSVDTNIII